MFRIRALQQIRIFFLLIISVVLVSCGDRSDTEESFAGDESYRLAGKTMGTTWSVVFGESAHKALNENNLLVVLDKAIASELARLNSLMSTWDPESELSRFNALRSIEPQSLHPDTLAVIDTAREVSQRTDGRYDITLADVINLWGFGSEDRIDAPDAQTLQRALDHSGHHQLVRTGETVRKRNPNIKLDVSSLAKGFAVDQIGRLLEAHNLDDYVAEIGGELRVRGFSRANEPWHIGVEHPDGSVNEGLSLTDSHVATSGSYRNYREIDGRRRSHIIDGSNGRPIEHALVAVTVLHDSTMLADAWATALLVVGEKRGRSLSDEMNLAVQLTAKSGNMFSVYRSPRFQERILVNP